MAGLPPQRNAEGPATLLRRMAALPLLLILPPLMILLHPLESRAGEPCGQAVLELKKPLAAVQKLGGLFILFDRFPALSGHSALAIQLDSRILKMHHDLVYLCETAHGVPPNELAAYVSRKVSQLGEDGFREKQSVLGRPEKEIQAWIDYAATARRLEKRTLDAARLQSTLEQAAPYFQRYRDLALALDAAEGPSGLLENATALDRDVQAFIRDTPYLALARKEKDQVPYWDFDENHGGS